MRIISDFRDYYDCVQSLDNERDIVYLRKPITELGKNYPFPLLKSCTYASYVEVKPYIIGFCNKIYPVIALTSTKVYPYAEHFCHNIDDVDKFINKYCSKKSIDAYRLSRNKKYASLYVYIRRYALEEFFDTCTNESGNYTNIFLCKNSPIFVASLNDHVGNYTLAWNVCLKHYSFFRVVGPQVAYQEILMFLNNIAKPLKPIPKVSDSDLIVAKGFDKYSFRKEKQCRKK